MSTATVEIRRLAAHGYGWEDIYIRLLAKGLIEPKDRMAIRRFVLCLSRRAAA